MISLDEIRGMAAKPHKSCRPRSTSRLGRAPTIETAFHRQASVMPEMPSDLRFWSPRSDSNRRPSDYESKSLRPACAAQTRSGCSRQRGRPLSAFLTCRVTAGGMTKGMTSLATAGQPAVLLPSDPVSDGRASYFPPVGGHVATVVASPMGSQRMLRLMSAGAYANSPSMAGRSWWKWVQPS